MMSRARHSLTAKLLIPLAACGLASVVGFSEWARSTEAGDIRRRASHTAEVIAGTLELSADLSGSTGLERAAATLGSERGIGLLAVVAGEEREVVASNDLVLKGTAGQELGVPLGVGLTGESSGPARAEPSVVEHGHNLDVSVPIDLGALALRSPQYREASLVLEVDRDYAGLGGGGDQGMTTERWLLLAIVAALLGVSAAAVQVMVLRPLRRLNRSIATRHEGDLREIPAGPPDEIGVVARTLATAFATIDDRERALRENEQRFRALIEGGNDLVVVVDAEGRISYASPSAGRALGYAPDEVVGRDAFAFVYPDDLDKAGGRFVELLENPGVANIQQFNIRLVSADGGLLPVEVRGNNRFDAPGVEGLILNMRDVTERNEATEALRASETRNRAILESAADGIVMLSADGRVESCNGAAERMFGRAASEMVGAPISDLVVVRSSALHDESLAETGSDRQGATFIDVEGRSADGGVFPIEAAVSAAASEGGVGFTVVLRDVTEQREYERRLAHLALHDGLTGLPNRRALLDRAETAIARARRSGQHVAVLFLDLDRFKVVNDSLGHEQGDRLLRLAAERMQSSIRESDTLARIGGDEFVVLCEGVDTVLSITELAARLCASLAEPFQLGESEAFVGGSIGVAVWDGGGTTADDLMRRADTAMYRAKEAGRGRYELFDDAMQAWAVERLDFETSLRHAVERDEMLLHYQPVVCLDTGAVDGFEALLRWERPGRGLVPPVEFIGVAEETGLIVPIGAWVIEEACRQAADWQRISGRPDLSMHVNVSSRQLGDRDIIDRVRRALTTHDIDPETLVLELTESVFLGDSQNALSVLTGLKSLGVKLSLDDFGTGYSSLTYLNTYPIDQIKIDRSFVAGLGCGTDEAIVEAIMQIARTLGIEVVAEGLERPEQIAVLVALGCPQGQGYWFSRPVVAEMATALLTSGADLGSR